MFTISVIIPTYNRKKLLINLLRSLDNQSIASQYYSVILVDDGSSDSTDELEAVQFSYKLKYISTQNRGPTLARNTGALLACSDILVFIDDDIVISYYTLEALAEIVINVSQVIALGTLIDCSCYSRSPFAQLATGISNKKVLSSEDEFTNFINCKTGLMAIKRDDFERIGMFQDPTGGWPNWDDVDFGYRAHLKGYRFLLSHKAIGRHCDYSLANLSTFGNRYQQASKSAFKLLSKYPNLQSFLPMFEDKTPINWKKDPTCLLVRKLARIVLSSHFSMRVLNHIVKFLEQKYPAPIFLTPIYRWIVGGYIFKGYRQGMREFNSITSGQ